MRGKLLTFLFLFFSAISFPDVLINWNVDSNGFWNVNGNWNPATFPNAVDDIANFSTAITAPRVITLNQDVTVKSLTFNSSHSYTISGSNTITMDASSPPSLIQSNDTSTHYIGSSISLNNALTIQALSTGTLNILGNISGGFGITTAGNVNLTGTNTYTGGVTLSSGTLTGTTNSLKGNIANGSALVFDQTSDGTYSGNISGIGTVTKTSSGNVTFTGTNTYSGATTISNGKLSIDGTSISPVIIASGGELGGSGVIMADIFCSGKIRPGDSIGTLEITGDITFNSGSTFEVELNPTDADLLDITGMVTINSGATIEILPDMVSGPYPVNSRYTVIQTTAGVNGTFDNITSTYPSFIGEVSYDDPNTVEIWVNMVPFNQIIKGGNPGTVAAHIDAIGPFPEGSDIDNVVEKIQFLEARAMREALDLLHPALYKGMVLSQQNNSMQINSIISKRCRGNCRNICKNKSKINIWADTFGNFYIQDGYKSFYTKTAGAIFGADFEFAKNSCIGTLLGYSYSYLRWDSSEGNSDINSYYLGIYSAFCTRRFFINGSFLGGISQYGARRKIDILDIHRTAKTDHLGAEGCAKVEMGAIKKMNFLKLLPFVSLDVLYLFTQEFKETGADSLNLKVRKKNYMDYRTQMGFYLKRCKKKKVNPFVKFSWIKEIRSFGKGYKAKFRDYSHKFEVQGTYPDRDLFSADLGFVKRFAKKKGKISLKYAGEFGDKYVNNAIDLDVGYGF